MHHGAQPGRQDEWKADGLYRTVLHFLPSYETRRGKLDVRRLGANPAIGKSAEAIYRWFRKDDLLNLDNARALVSVAGSDENLAALQQLGRQPPSLEDLIRFA